MGFSRTVLFKGSQVLSVKNKEAIEPVDQLRMLTGRENLTLIVLGQEEFLCTALIQCCYAIKLSPTLCSCSVPETLQNIFKEDTENCCDLFFYGQDLNSSTINVFVVIAIITASFRTIF